MCRISWSLDHGPRSWGGGVKASSYFFHSPAALSVE